MTIIIPIILIVLVDQISKFAVRVLMTEGQSIHVIGKLFKITYLQNDGAAFSSLRGQRGFLVGFALLAVLAALFFLFSYKGKSKLLDCSLLMIVAGGIGNLIDRIFIGSVTDMFDLSFFPPIFNLADISITIGCILLIIFIIFGDSEILK